MEAVEDVQCLGALLTDDFQIGLPHVGADEDDLRSHFVANNLKESLKGFDGPLAADPEQAGHAEVDLVDQRQVLMPFGVLDLVDSDGVDLAELTVSQSIGDDMFDSVEDFVP